MITYVLLIVLYGYEGSITTINQEFSSVTTCDIAGTHILQNLTKHGQWPYVLSQGCYKK